jgi:hypothetical protein
MQIQNSNLALSAQAAKERVWLLPSDWPICSLCDFHPILQPVEPACEQLSEPVSCPICGASVGWVTRSTRRAVTGYIEIIQRWVNEAHR